MPAFHFEIREPPWSETTKTLDPRVADALIEAVADFAAETGVASLEISYAELNEPIELAVHFGMVLETGEAIDLLRRGLSEPIGWFMFRDEGRFYVHSGQEVNFFIGSAVPCTGPLARAREAGLQVWEYTGPSQYTPHYADPADLGQPVNDELWDRLSKGDREYLVLERFAMNFGGITAYQVSSAAECGVLRASLRPHSALAVLEVASLVRASDIDGALLTEWEQNGMPSFEMALVWPGPRGNLGADGARRRFLAARVGASRPGLSGTPHWVGKLPLHAWFSVDNVLPGSPHLSPPQPAAPLDALARRHRRCGAWWYPSEFGTARLYSDRLPRSR